MRIFNRHRFRQLPINWRLSHRYKGFVSFWKWTGTKESTISRKRARMWWLQHNICISIITIPSSWCASSSNLYKYIWQQRLHIKTTSRKNVRSFWIYRGKSSRCVLWTVWHSILIYENINIVFHNIKVKRADINKIIEISSFALCLFCIIKWLLCDIRILSFWIYKRCS